MILALLLVLVQAPAPVMDGGVPGVQPAPSAPASPEAYYAFLEARRLEEAGEIDAAARALERAAKADPASAEVRAEMAALYARQNDGTKAAEAARAALALDPANGEANFVLGTILAANLSETRPDPAARADAIAHLEKAREARPYDQGLALMLARLRIAAGQTSEAIALLEPLAEGGGSVEAGYLLAQSHERQGQLDRAVSVLAATLDAEPRFFRGWAYLGELSERRQEYAAAAVAYGRAVALNPRGSEMRVRQGQALLNADQVAAARKVLADAVAATPTEGMALYLLAEAERRLGDLDAAESTARRLVALEPSGLRGAYALAEVYEARYEHDEVVAILEPAIARATRAGSEGTVPPRQVVSLLIKLGLAHLELGDFDRAIATFERARTVMPADAGLGVYLAQAQMAAGRHEAALATIEMGRKTVPESVTYVRLEAAVLSKLGRHDEAVAALAPLATAPDAAPELVVALATAQSDAGRVDEAVATLAAAEARITDTPLLPFQRGALLEQAGRYAEAEAAFKDALARDPLHAPTLNYFGYMLADRNERLDEALSLVQRALGVDSHNPSYIDSLGWTLFRLGRYEEARTELARAAERLPRNSVVLDHYGDVLARLGDHPAAVSAWRAALAGDGEQIDRAAIEKKIAGATRE
ncbi:MAG: tetratricopeptide repeat protein [Vicinamibacteraceae bacterium]|nr:tetratricopeptide repeat protein [Vicinamibacteraceae bacterium]